MVLRQLYGSRRSRIRDVQIDNLGDLYGIRKIDRVPDVWITEFYVTEGVDERNDESIVQWFSHIERMGNDRITIRIYVGKCMGSRSVGRPRKRWIDSVNECLEKKEVWMLDKQGE